MIVAIPLPVDVPLFEQTITLDGSDFVVRFDYNARQDRWLVSLATTAGEPLVRGRKVTANWNLLRLTRTEGTPTGALLVIDRRYSTDGGGPSPGFSDLGRTVQLAYISRSELP